LGVAVYCAHGTGFLAQEVLHRQSSAM